MHIDDYVCQGCKRVVVSNYEKNSWQDPNPLCPVCGDRMEKDWANCKIGLMNRGQPVNSRLCNDGETINKHFAADDPLTAIEVGLKSDNGSGLKTFSSEQARHYREKIQKGEDSVKLRQEILDVRATNEATKKANRKSKLLGV